MEKRLFFHQTGVLSVSPRDRGPNAAASNRPKLLARGKE